MEPTRMAAVIVATLMLTQGDARSPSAPSSHTALVVEKSKGSWSPKISPPLRDVKSDKKFFGPPFPADYPEDSRPVPDKAILNKLKGPDQPYPALQSKEDYDKDYVKDENSDTGAWRAQFEYDALRKKLAKEEADARAAGQRADKEGHDLDEAQRRADDARKGVDDATRGVDEAHKGEEHAMTPEEVDELPDDTLKQKKEKLEKLKKAVGAAEARLAREEKEFEQCKKELEAAKKNLDELRAAEKEMEAKLAADTKLWMETKTMRLNAHKAKQEAAHAKHAAVMKTANEKLQAAQAAKADMDKMLAEKKAVHASAEENLRKERAQLQSAKASLEKAALTLQKMRGYKPTEPATVKSSAPMTSVLLSFWTLTVVALF